MRLSRRDIKKNKERLEKLKIILDKLKYPKEILRDEELKLMLTYKAEELAILTERINKLLSNKKNIPIKNLTQLKCLTTFFITALTKYFQLANTNQPVKWMTLVNCSLKTYYKATQSQIFPKAKNFIIYNLKGHVIRKP